MNDVQKIALGTAGVGFAGLSIVSYAYSPAGLNLIFGKEVVEANRSLRNRMNASVDTLKDQFYNSKTISEMDKLIEEANENKTTIVTEYSEQNRRMAYKIKKLNLFFKKRSISYTIPIAVIALGILAFFLATPSASASPKNNKR